MKNSQCSTVCLTESGKMRFDSNPEFKTMSDAIEAARAFCAEIVAGKRKVKLLTRNTAKMEKSGYLGFLSVVLHLQAAFSLNGFNTCPWSTVGCRKVCLQNAGRMRFGGAFFARLWRTILFLEHRDFFFTLLIKELESAKKSAARKNLGYTIRLNGTSDISWENYKIGEKTLFEIFSDCVFYDYTKSADRALSVKIPNYRLVYSHNEKSDLQVEKTILDRGGLIAMVFNTKKSADLPTGFEIEKTRYPVLDGDLSDLRHLDPAGSIVGLRYKLAFDKKTRKAIAPPAGFVVSIGRSNIVR